MSAATANNIRTSFTSVDLSAMMGYPLRIHINGAAGSKPLFWESWSRNERGTHSEWGVFTKPRLTAECSNS